MDKKAGRPRSEKTRKLILTTAYELLLKNGFKSVTVDSIAEKSGVSKATIYKWWPNKASVIIDAFFEESESILPVPDTGSIREDLFIQANNLAIFLKSSRGKVITELIAEGQFDHNIALEYRTRYFLPRRLISQNILQRGIQRGELTPNTDIELSIDMIFSPLFYRQLITGEPIDTTYIKKIIDYTIKGLA